MVFVVLVAPLLFALEGSLQLGTLFYVNLTSKQKYVFFSAPPPSPSFFDIYLKYDAKKFKFTVESTE